MLNFPNKKELQEALSEFKKYFLERAKEEERSLEITEHPMEHDKSAESWVTSMKRLESARTAAIRKRAKNEGKVDLPPITTELSDELSSLAYKQGLKASVSRVGVDIESIGVYRKFADLCDDVAREARIPKLTTSPFSLKITKIRMLYYYPCNCQSCLLAWCA